MENKTESVIFEQEMAATKNSVLKRIQFELRSYLAEFLGTLILVLFGCGSIAQVTVNKAAVGSSYLSINLGWGLGLTMAVYIVGQVSGGHLNPDITIANMLFRKFPKRQVPGYILAQTLGSFIAAALIYFIYWPVFTELDGGIRSTIGPLATAGIFATYPYNESYNYNSFITELIITSIFVICIMGITDHRTKIPSYLFPIAIGASICAIGLSVGVMTGFALNPARDFGPRLFTALAGWGSDPFTSNSYYFWIPIVAPTVGAIIGIFIYDMFIFPTELNF